MKYRVISIILFTTTIPIYLTSKPVADSLKMDYRDDTEPENEVWHSSLSKVEWKQAVDGISSGDTIDDVRVINILLKQRHMDLTPLSLMVKIHYYIMDIEEIGLTTLSK